MVKWIVIALLGLIVLGYLGFDVRKAVEAPLTQSNLEYAKNVVSYLWNTYLKKPATYLWNEIFLKLILGPLMGSLENKITSPTTMSTSTLPGK